MAEILNIDFKMNKVLVTIEMTAEENQKIGRNRDILILPVSPFSDVLTTGTLGNSNRIMLPNKILKKNDVACLRKKVPCSILKIKGGKYLVIELEGPNTEIPYFK